MNAKTEKTHEIVMILVFLESPISRRGIKTFITTRQATKVDGLEESFHLLRESSIVLHRTYRGYIGEASYYVDRIISDVSKGEMIGSFPW